MKMRALVGILVLLFLCNSGAQAKGFIFGKQTKPYVAPIAQKQYTIDDYMKDMERLIKSNWAPPENSFKNKTVVNFQISRDGTIRNSKICETSGDAEFDRGAMKALATTGKLPPLPNNFLGASIDINFTFERFSYLVKKDRYDR